MQRNKNDKNSRGVVLIIVLVLFMALSSLTLMTIEVSSRGAVEASRVRSEYEAGFKAEEALYVIYDLLNDDNTPFSESPREEWAKKWEDEGLSIEITPCNGKINVNSIFSFQDQKRALEILGEILPKGTDTRMMAGSLAVWGGMNVNSQLKRLDSIYYATQFPSYSMRGKKFKTPEEVLLVRGWGGLGREWIDKYITVWGSGKININFAPPEVLEAYFPELGNSLQTILHWRRTRGFTDISQLLSITGIEPSSKLYKNMINELTVRSDYFDARVKATVGGCTVEKRYIIARKSTFEVGEPELVHQNDFSVTFADDEE
ncbi:general secretion pathway protein GspK [Maridesulfovibrio sp.]|uniref:general secretion pathway protein GspK n=1 Tax=Maridesulfovibrio sp. TaxID=2795000 RepID=UPI0039EEEE44